jgi:hypothetical protein
LERIQFFPSSARTVEEFFEHWGGEYDSEPGCGHAESLTGAIFAALSTV